MNEYGLHGMGFGWLILLPLIILVLYFIKDNKKEEITARNILDKRYANGEIDEREYKIKRADLEK